jgi:hypothetical protein
MNSLIRTGANLVVKVAYDAGPAEKIVGFATALTYNVSNGLKINHVVDNPYPAELAYGSMPMQVSGTLSLIMPKGTTLEKAGLVPYRTAGGASEKDGAVANFGSGDTVYIGGGKYCHLRVYDRESTEMVFGCEFMKVQSFQINVQSKAVVRADINFIGKYLVPGAG